MIRVMLNRAKSENYAFFCPDTRLHLTLSSPGGTATGLSPAIIRGLKGDSLIDVDGVFDLETMTIRGQEVSDKSQKPKVKVEKSNGIGTDNSSNDAGRSKDGQSSATDQTGLESSGNAEGTSETAEEPADSSQVSSGQIDSETGSIQGTNQSGQEVNGGDAVQKSPVQDAGTAAQANDCTAPAADQADQEEMKVGEINADPGCEESNITEETGTAIGEPELAGGTETAEDTVISSPEEGNSGEELQEEVGAAPKAKSSKSSNKK